MNEEDREVRDFFMLNSDTFTVTSVKGKATTRPDGWFVSGEGTLNLGVNIFADKESLREYARKLLYNRTQLLNDQKKAFDKI